MRDLETIAREWERKTVECVICPECSFTFDAMHEDRDGGYTCPQCEEGRLRAELANAQTGLQAVPLLQAENMTLHSQLQAVQADYGALEHAAEAFLAKIRRIHASAEYQAVWFTAQIHRGPYTGEKYEPEMQALAELLAATPKDTP